MALIFCPECGAQISEHALQCVKCSYPIRDRLRKDFDETPKNNNFNQFEKSSINEKPTNNISKPLVTVIILGMLFFFYNFNNETTSQQKEDVNKSTTTNNKSSEDDSFDNNSNTCAICGRNFIGKGYEEVSNGVWIPIKGDYLGSICSSACGKKHSGEYDRILTKHGYGKMNNNNSSNNEDYEQGKDGRIYETKPCQLCKGTGIESAYNYITEEQETRVCPMCFGKGVRSY